HFYSSECNCNSGNCLSGGASCPQAVLHSICPVRSPATCSLGLRRIAPSGLDSFFHLILGGIMLASYKKSLHLAFVAVFCFILASNGNAQSGNSTSVTGAVVDPSGAVVPGATVEIRNPVSGFSRSTTTDNAGKFSIPNVPFNPYHVTVTKPGFAPYAQDIDV